MNNISSPGAVSRKAIPEQLDNLDTEITILDETIQRLNDVTVAFRSEPDPSEPEQSDEVPYPVHPALACSLNRQQKRVRMLRIMIERIIDSVEI